MKASKGKARQGSTEDSDNSPGTSFQRIATDKSSLTDERKSEITEQIECKIDRKVKEEVRKTEITILRALGFLSENSPNGDTNDLSISRAAGEKKMVTIALSLTD